MNTLKNYFQDRKCLSFTPWTSQGSHLFWYPSYFSSLANFILLSPDPIAHIVDTPKQLLGKFARQAPLTLAKL